MANQKGYSYKKIVILSNEKALKAYSRNQRVKASVDSYLLKDDIHDRFALMDGELWHCGATAGGLHGAVNALSRGWEDKDNKMLEYIEQVISEDRV